MKRPTSSSLHCAPHSSFSRFVNCLGLLVDNSESLFVRCINNTYTFTVDQSRITITAQICQVVGFLNISHLIYYCILIKTTVYNIFVLKILQITNRWERLIDVALLKQEGIVVTNYHPIQMRRHLEFLAIITVIKQLFCIIITNIFLFK